MLPKALTRSKRRLTRYSILAANLLVLSAVVLFVAKSSTAQHALTSTSLSSSADNLAQPLDQVSSADIAVNVARMTNLAEATSAANQADSVNALLTVSNSEQTIVAKPEVVSTVFKSNKDILKYITKVGDTVSKLAARFHVTSESIKSSNGLVNDKLAAGQTLYIPPFNGIVYVVRKGDTPSSLAARFHSNRDQIIAFNDAEISGLKPGTRIVIPNGFISTEPATVAFVPSGFQATFGSFNGYDFGWCTWYAAKHRADLGHPVPSNLGNAYSWYYLAQSAGLPTGLTPRVGAVAVNLGGNHVSVVEKVNSDGSFIVSEMNASGYDSIGTIGQDGHYIGGWGVVDYRVYSGGSYGFIY